MLRMYFVQHWFNLADEACEEALLDSTALRRFVGIDLGRERVPDGTTLLKFRRRLEEHHLGEAVRCDGTGAADARPEAKMAPAHDRGRHAHRRAQFDEECRQGTRPRDAPDAQGPAVVLRHEAHIGVTAAPGWRTARWSRRPTCTTSTCYPNCCTAPSSASYGDSAYASQKDLIESKAPRAQDFTNQRVRKGGWIDEIERAKNRNKSRVRARVEHVFAVVKRLWVSPAGWPRTPRARS